MTFPTLSDLDVFSGTTCRLRKRSGEFILFQQYNLVGGKVREKWKGKGEGFGKWVETTYLPSPHYTIINPGGMEGWIGLVG